MDTLAADGINVFEKVQRKKQTIIKIFFNFLYK